MANKTVYATMDDVEAMVTDSLGEYAAEHDVRAIADAVTVWDDESHSYVDWTTVEKYWQIVERYAN